MSFEIVDALIHDQHFAVEAGVGIGKSFGYLVPVLLYILTFQVMKARTGKHTGHLSSAAYRAEKPRFSTLITTYFPPYLSSCK